ncbi:MAG: matrixin family metalloprotease [Nanoarchaeota archaeon]
MKKRIKNKKNLYVRLIIVFVTILISIYFLNFDNKNKKEDKENDQFSDIKEIHFNHMPITYSLNVNTSESFRLNFNKTVYRTDTTDDFKIKRIQWAFDLIEKSTDNLMVFKEVKEDENPDIRILGVPDVYCYNENETYDGREGFAGPENYTSNKIINSTVVFCATGYSVGFNIKFSWEYAECEDFPIVELHEIFHAFGFGHTFNNNKEVMYPIKFRIKSCEINQIDPQIISCLKYIYSNGNLSGDCSDRNIFPWSNETDSFEDFKWDNLPVKYSVLDCNENQKKNIILAEEILEEYAGFNLYEQEINGKSQVNFYCKDSFDDILLNENTDFWTTTDYFPAAQPEYYFEDNGKINEVKITFFAQNRNCGGIELHELLHGLGLRNHYGDWMFYERSICSKEGVIDGDSIDELKYLYSLE